ncbi:Retrovirus-related Pol polyprotein from transposon 17.6 [Gossypium australe]|uniref:Retrovirus-related Pol polyprotein from transposon 17.6 n=1 Tax=Gossypium australe TaxID=47621 RepID=A0A5B6WFX8_9ROSI|nr:Retrovirus-related Pol polyprotein from transposon 17.6 [Gossypium australe]
MSHSLCMHKILLEDDKIGTIDGQRRLNLITKEVVKKEMIKWLDFLVNVPKKGGTTVLENENNELILTMTIIGWQICINYRKLNKATRKDHFLLLFLNQMLDKLAGQGYYCFLDEFSGYNQRIVDSKDQHRTTLLARTFQRYLLVCAMHLRLFKYE